MFACMLSSKDDYWKKRVANVSPDVHRLVLLLSRDVIHCASRGWIKTPKHVMLPVMVKSLTGNTEVVTILNRFGHGLSYSQIEELETALAEKEIERQRGGVLLPSVCSPGVPGLFCWDNNDLQEETLSGIALISDNRFRLNQCIYTTFVISYDNFRERNNSLYQWNSHLKKSTYLCITPRNDKQSTPY